MESTEWGLSPLRDTARSRYVFLLMGGCTEVHGPLASIRTLPICGLVMNKDREVLLLPHPWTAQQKRESTMNDFFFKLYVAAQAFLDRKNGQGLTEYALAFTIIALGTVAGESAVAEQVNHTFISIASTISTRMMQ